jgi:hypothetical protein
MAKKLYETIFRAKGLCDGAMDLLQMAENLETAADSLRRMAADGVELERVVDDDYAFLVTGRPSVAKKHGLTERTD